MRKIPMSDSDELESSESESQRNKGKAREPLKKEKDYSTIQLVTVFMDDEVNDKRYCRK